MSLPDKQVTLRDGRLLGVAEFGAPDGEPAFYFHGFPASRLEALLLHALARERGARILALDRPGYGLSDFAPGREIADWPDDVLDCADALGIDRFSVVGVSGGGPYAAACALRLPVRLKTVGIVCGLGPLDERGATKGMIGFNACGLRFAARLPSLARPVFALATQYFRRRPEVVVRRLAEHSPPTDKDVLARPEVADVICRSYSEAFRSGSAGACHDLVLYTRPWGFALSDIRRPVFLWHGESDTIVPAALGRRVARAIPDCRSFWRPGEGHFSLAVNYAGEVIQTLMDGARG